jgi:hypothetical protein
MVRVRRFELRASCARGKRSASLSYTLVLISSKGKKLMASFIFHCEQIVLPAIRQAIAAHTAQGCIVADGADRRALEAALSSLKADETHCDEPPELDVS